MKLIKTILTHSIAIFIITTAIVGLEEIKNASEQKSNNEFISQEAYIIHDCYTQEGGRQLYSESLVENVDRSISFIDEDGLITRIPYPYYSIKKIQTTKYVRKSI